MTPPLTRSLKLAFGVGGTGESILFTAASSFVLVFYNQVLGVRADLVGVALSIGLAVNAVCDPLIGSWSDRTRSRLGRRHPFMYASILPIALSFFALFNPPESLGPTGDLVWLCVTNIILWQALSLFHTPHLALGGELSDSYIERSEVMNYNTFFLWIGDTLSWLLSFGWFFRSERSDGSNAALSAASWPKLSAVVAGIAFVTFSLSSLGTRARIPFLPQPAAGTPGFGLSAFVRDVRCALSNRSYVELLIGFLLISLMSGLRGGLWFYTATFYWQLSSGQIAFFVIGSATGYVFGATVVTRMHRRFDKRWSCAGAALIYTIGPAVPLALGYFGVLTPATPLLLPILIAFSILQHAPYSIMTTTLYSALADIADENELRYGTRQEGVLYSTRTFFAKIDQAVGAALAGWVLHGLIAFPDKAVPGQVPAPVLAGLAVAFVVSTVPGVLGAGFFARLRVTKGSYEATRAALALR